MLAGVAGLALGDVHSLVLKQDGSVWSTGATLHDLSASTGIEKPFVKVIVNCITAVVARNGQNMVLKWEGSKLRGVMCCVAVALTILSCR